MKIVFDGHIFASQKYGGVSRYIFELTNALFCLGVDIDILSPLFVNEYLRNNRPTFLNGNFIPYIPHTGFLRRFANTLLSNVELSKNYRHTDIIHETYYSRYGLNSSMSHHVLTVYDMIHEIYSEFFSRFDQTSFLKRRSIDRSSLILCISHSTKQDFFKFFPHYEKRVEVVHPGFRPLGKPRAGQAKVGMKMRDGRYFPSYILFVGQREGYKNFRNILRAFEKSKFLKKNLNILCFGGGLPSKAENELVATLGLSRNIRYTSGSDDSLVEAYQNAIAFVYPSLYEGFGIPPLEAMSMDCPVICSQTSSIPEVVGEAGAYFDPNDVDDISQQIENIICSTERREQLIRNGRKRYPIFSWRSCAEKTLSLYRSILDS